MIATALSTPEWYCLRAQPKREHMAAEHLRLLEGMEVFCPRLRYRKATRRGKVWWVEPLFPGYVLAKFDFIAMERAATFTHGIRGIVRFGPKIPTIAENFVNSIRHDIRERSEDHSFEETLTTCPIIKIGDEVEVAHGPLQGMNGTILSVAPAAERVKILLEFLGQSQPIDIDLFSLILPRRPYP